MGFLFKILGGIGLILVLVVLPNLRNAGSSKADLLLIGLSILILGVGVLLDRVDRLLAAKTSESSSGSSGHSGPPTPPSA